MQTAPFPPQPAAHLSAHDAACAKLEPEKIIRQNIALLSQTILTLSPSPTARGTEGCPFTSNIILLFKQVYEARRSAANIAKLPELLR